VSVEVYEAQRDRQSRCVYGFCGGLDSGLLKLAYGNDSAVQDANVDLIGIGPSPVEDIAVFNHQAYIANLENSAVPAILTGILTRARTSARLILFVRAKACSQQILYHLR